MPSLIGFENAYNGAWFEMFLLENQPLGHITVRKVSASSGAMAKLGERAARPLHPSDATSRLTPDHRASLDVGKSAQEPCRTSLGFDGEGAS